MRLHIQINLEKYIVVTCIKEKEFGNKINGVFLTFYKVVLRPFSFQLLYFDFVLFATYLLLASGSVAAFYSLQ